MYQFCFLPAARPLTFRISWLPHVPLHQLSSLTHQLQATIRDRKGHLTVHHYAVTVTTPLPRGILPCGTEINGNLTNYTSQNITKDHKTFKLETYNQRGWRAGRPPLSRTSPTTYLVLRSLSVPGMTRVMRMIK